MKYLVSPRRSCPLLALLWLAAPAARAQSSPGSSKTRALTGSPPLTPSPAASPTPSVRAANPPVTAAAATGPRAVSSSGPRAVAALAPARPAALLSGAATSRWASRASLGEPLELRLCSQLAAATVASLDATLTAALPPEPSVTHLLEVTRADEPRPAATAPAPVTRLPVTRLPMAAVPEAPGAPAEPPPGEPRMSSRHRWAYVTAGVGLASLGLMAGFGLRAVLKEREHEGGCSSLGCTQGALDAFDSAKTSARISHAFGITAAASLGVSAYLFFFRSDSRPRRMSVSPIFGLARDVGLAAGGMTMKASW